MEPPNGSPVLPVNDVTNRTVSATSGAGPGSSVTPAISSSTDITTVGSRRILPRSGPVIGDSMRPNSRGTIIADDQFETSGVTTNGSALVTTSTISYG